MQDGVYVYRKPCKPTAVHPFVVPGDIVLFVSLLANSPPKHDLLGASEMASYIEYMKIWSEVTGVPSEARQISVEEADKGGLVGLGGMGRRSRLLEQSLGEMRSLFCLGR